MFGGEGSQSEFLEFISIPSRTGSHANDSIDHIRGWKSKDTFFRFFKGSVGKIPWPGNKSKVCRKIEHDTP